MEKREASWASVENEAGRVRGWVRESRVVWWRRWEMDGGEQRLCCSSGTLRGGMQW